MDQRVGLREPRACRHGRHAEGAGYDAAEAREQAVAGGDNLTEETIQTASQEVPK